MNRTASRLTPWVGLFCILTAAWPALAADKTWTPTVGDSFTEDANWVPAGAPTGGDNALFLDPTVTAVIDFEGSRELGSFHLGTTGATGGNVVFSSGELTVHADFDSSHIGDQNSLDSTFIMQGDAVMLYDEPLDGGGGGLGGNGGGQDLEIGAQTGASGTLGKLEVHDNAVLRIGDDLKIGAEADGNGEVLIDGNAEVTVGSGISVSEADRSVGKLTVGGNALLVSGNSAGAGNSAEGFTDEGYFTMSVRSGEVASSAEIVIQDSGKIYARTLQHREGPTSLTIQDNGEFHIFDTFQFAAPDLGVATVAGDPNSEVDRVKASTMSDGANSSFNLLLRDNAVMTVDSAMDDGTGLSIQGLALTGSNNLGQVTGTGGVVDIEIRDSASFMIQQNLYMTLASAATPTGAESTLRVVGPDATVHINGDLLMSFDPTLSKFNADPSTIDAVITGDSHTTIEVGGDANIQFGNLSVELDGYSPVGGESYTLINAGSITGTEFRATDFTLAPLDPALSWDLQIDATTVVLNVMGSLPGVSGDYNEDGVVNAADYVVWRNLNGTSADLPNRDPNASGDIDQDDYLFWVDHFGNSGSASGSTAAVPEPASLLLAFVGSLAALLLHRADATTRGQS